MTDTLEKHQTTVLHETDFEDDACCEFTACSKPAAWICATDCPGCGFKSRVLACDPCKRHWMTALEIQDYRVWCRKCDCKFIFNGTWRPA